MPVFDLYAMESEEPAWQEKGKQGDGRKRIG